MSKKKKPYYPNNWQAYANCPDEFFESLPIEQFMDWRVEGWEIPSSIACIIREEDKETGTINEYVYSRNSAAQKRVNKIMNKGNTFIVCGHDGLHHMYPKDEELYDDPLA
tara:strand:+ start:72 stop:401 length:330 start_codon:yes stop_codon:yes gene_type:complete